MKAAGDKKLQHDESYYVASQWQLMWRKLKKHKLAMTAVPMLGILYFIAIFCEFVGPYGAFTRFPDYLNAPPQRIRFISEDEGFKLRPFVYDLEREIDPVTYQRTFILKKDTKHNIRLFAHGEAYKLWGLIRSDIHLFVSENGPVFLFGTDRLGRDLFSRIMYASRISLTIGLVGVSLTFIFGSMLGGIAGYFGGTADSIIMRSVDLLISIPRIPLWMALSAALPRDWSVIKTYFAITIVLSIIGWTSLARVVRGKLLVLREEDFTMAAKISGASSTKIITTHLLPSFFSYLIVNLTLAIPQMILGETALSFLGLGLQPPAVSWGTLLQDAQNFRSVAHNPWLLIPCLFVIITVLAFNCLGDGLRDAADPYK